MRSCGFLGKKVNSEKFYSFHISSKKGQFFILSAIIIATIIVGFAGVRNYAQTGQAPQKFYFYSEQLEKETGAVVDYALYNGNSNLIQEFLQREIARTQNNLPGLEVYACYTNPSDNTKLICINNGSSQIKVKTGNMNSFVNVNGTKTINTVLSGGKEACDIYIPARFVCSVGYCCNQTKKSVLPANNTNRCYYCGTTQETTGCSGTCQTNLTIKSGSNIEKNITIQLSNGMNYTLSINSPLIQPNQFYFIFKINTSTGTYVDTTGNPLSPPSV